MLGGRRVLGRNLKSQLDAHEILVNGLPATAFDALVKNLIIHKHASSLYKAVGISLRTYQRHKDAPDRLLSKEQSGRIWKFAEILAKATRVLGSQAEAERWLDLPAIGLDQHRPIDLLVTPVGVGLVEDYLSRLEYGVYT